MAPVFDLAALGWTPEAVWGAMVANMPTFTPWIGMALVIHLAFKLLQNIGLFLGQIFGFGAHSQGFGGNPHGNVMVRGSAFQQAPPRGAGSWRYDGDTHSWGGRRSASRSAGRQYRSRRR